MEDDTSTLVTISLKLDNKTNMVYTEIQSDKFLGSLYTPLREEDIKNKDIYSLAEVIRGEMVNLFS